jgi:hypothetical protein
MQTPIMVTRECNGPWSRAVPQFVNGPYLSGRFGHYKIPFESDVRVVTLEAAREALGVHVVLPSKRGNVR